MFFSRHFILPCMQYFSWCKIDMRCVNKKAATSSISSFSFFYFSVIIMFNERLLCYMRNALMRLTWKEETVKREWTAFCVHPPLMENIEFFPVNTEHPSRNSMHPWETINMPGWLLSIRVSLAGRFCINAPRHILHAQPLSQNWIKSIKVPPARIFSNGGKWCSPEIISP